MLCFDFFLLGVLKFFEEKRKEELVNFCLEMGLNGCLEVVGGFGYVVCLCGWWFRVDDDGYFGCYSVVIWV